MNKITFGEVKPGEIFFWRSNGSPCCKGEGLWWWFVPLVPNTEEQWNRSEHTVFVKPRIKEHLSTVEYDE